MWLPLFLAILTLEGCHAQTVPSPPPVTVPLPLITPPPAPKPAQHSVTTPPTGTPSIGNAISATDKAIQTIERRRYILDSRSDKKVIP